MYFLNEKRVKLNFPTVEITLTSGKKNGKNQEKVILYLQTSNLRTVAAKFLWNTSDLRPIKSNCSQIFSPI